MKTYEDCFSGAEAVEWLQHYINVQMTGQVHAVSREKVIQACPYVVHCSDHDAAEIMLPHQI